MPATIRSLLLLWSAVLLPGGGADAEPATAAPGVAAFDAPSTIQAVTPGLAWAWRISEADTAEEDSSDGDDLGLDPGGHSSRRGRPDPGPASAIRRDRAIFHAPNRSPILRC